MKKEDNNQWLDFCRAIAILMVLLSHGRGYLIPLWGPFNGLKFGGFLGVELFFTLSGFLIGKIIIQKSIHYQGNFSWIPAFWFRRWARTYPIYFLFILINLALLSGIRVSPIDKLWPFFIFTQSITTPHPFFFGEAWSLAIEEIFYFITPILYITSYYFFKDVKKSLICCLLIMITLPTLYRIYLSSQTNLSLNEIRTISLARLDSIMYGLILAWIFYFAPSLKEKTISLAKKIVILFPMMAYFLHFPDEILDSYQLLKIALFNAISLICAAMVICGINLKFSSYFLILIRVVARGSYISYLVNLPILYCMHRYIAPTGNFLEGIYLFIFYLLSTLFISHLIHELFEKKILLLRDKISPR